jgi:hypothetical protein
VTEAVDYLPVLKPLFIGLCLLTNNYCEELAV